MSPRSDGRRPTRERLLALVDALSGARVVVAGDAMLDEFVYGEIARVSREAPVLILHHR
ncbi:MAG: D-glycero-beta-D-manno-heptose-7-phosphate kinase, partial [Acidobacteria bacterium]